MYFNWEKKKTGLFSKWCSNTWVPTNKKINVDPKLIPYAKINSKEITKLNIKHKVKTFWRKQTRDVAWLALCGVFFNKTSKAQFTKEKNEEVGLY